MVGEPGVAGTPSKEPVMKKKRGITIRFGPLGLSLLAAGITAIGVAAVSLAASGNGSGGTSSGGGSRTFQLPPPPGGGMGEARVAPPNLSEADRKKLDEFRQCMEDNGAPAPPEPGRIDPSDGPPKPPNAADREKFQKAFEACKSKLPEQLRDAGPPGAFHCGPPPGSPPAQGQQQGQNQNQSNQPGAPSSGSS
jgi:hypothetical protein